MNKTVSKDECLRRLFQAQLDINQQTRGKEGACRMLAGEEVYLVNRTSVYKGAPSEEEERLPQGKVSPYSEAVEALEVKDTTRFRPEVMLCDDCAPLQASDMAGDSVLLVVAKPPDGAPGVWCLKRDKDNASFLLDRKIELDSTSRVLDIPLSPLEVPGHVLAVMSSCGYTPQDFKTSLAVSRLGLVPVLLMSGETGLLWTTLCKENEQSGMLPITTTAGTVYVGDAWNPADLAFKRLIKKRTKKMKGLGNPLTMKKTAPAPSPEPAVAAVPAEQPAVEQHTQSLAEAFDEALGGDPVVIADETGIEVEPCVEAQKPLDEAAKEPARKPRARRSARPAGLDLEHVLEALGSPVELDDASQLDAVVAELRTLRDLQIAAARRSANLSIAFAEFSKNTIERYAQIRELLK